MQIRTLSVSVKLRLAELKEIMKDYKVFFTPYEMPELIISPAVDESRLAYYDRSSDVIIFQEDFIMNTDKWNMKNILLHELSHALQFKLDGITDHGESFHHYCRLLGCDPDFSKAKVQVSHERRESYARKIEKLLALSSSPYEEESRSAILKAEELMASHGLEYAFQHRDEDKLYNVVLSTKGRFMQSEKELYALIRNLTGTFLVYEALAEENRRKASIYGTLEQIETAVYLHGYLQTELERSLRKAKKEKKGYFSSESYKLGLIVGLLEKLEKENADAERALVLSTRKNQEIYVDLMGARLRTRRNNATLNSLSDYNAGKENSRNIRIPGKNEKSSFRKQLEHR